MVVVVIPEGRMGALPPSRWSVLCEGKRIKEGKQGKEGKEGGRVR